MSFRILCHDVSVPIRNSWDVKLGVTCLCWPFSLLCFLFAISRHRSDFQHSSGTSVHFWLFCTIFLYNPIGVWYTLVYHCCWFPCSILPMLYPIWCTWEYFRVVSFWFLPLPFNEHGFPSFPALSINFLGTPTILSTNPLDLGWFELLVWCVMLKHCKNYWNSLEL